MQVWNLLHAARWKHRTQKCLQKSPSGHHPTTLSGYIFATKARIDNRKKIVKHQYVLHTSPQYGELRPTSGWNRLTSLWYPCKFQLVSHLGSVTERHLVVVVRQTLRRWTEHSSAWLQRVKLTELDMCPGGRLDGRIWCVAWALLQSISIPT